MSNGNSSLSNTHVCSLLIFPVHYVEPILLYSILRKILQENHSPCLLLDSVCQDGEQALLSVSSAVSIVNQSSVRGRMIVLSEYAGSEMGEAFHYKFLLSQLLPCYTWDPLCFLVIKSDGFRFCGIVSCSLKTKSLHPLLFPAGK